MKIVRITILLAFIMAYSLCAETIKFDANNFIVSNSNKTALVQSGENSFDFEVLNAQAKNIFNTGKNHIEIKNFPITPNYKVDLILSRQASAFTKDVEIKHFVNGKAEVLKRKSRDHYYGFIKGDAGSDIFISYSSLGLTGYIQNGNGQMYNISAYLNKLGKNEVLHNITATSMDEFLNKNKLQMCASDMVEDFRPAEINLNDIKKNNKIQAKDELYEVKMAADLNFEFYLMFCQFITGGIASQWKTGQAWFVNMTEEQYEQARQMAVDYVDNVMSAVSRIYTREVAILIKVGYVKLFDDPFADPYYPNFGQQLGDKLSAMPNIWNNRLDEATDRVLATVFTDVRRQTGGNVLGIAMSGMNYKGALCNKNMGYSALGMTGTVDFPIIPYSQDVEVAAHEFGHNFGCPHTHWCGWPSFGETIIDSCVSSQLADDAYCISPAQRRIKYDGTIMSYCHIGGKTQFNFHPRMKKRIREHTEDALSSCVYKPNYPIVRLVRPLGEEVYFAGTTATIAFQAANVPQAKLMYSSNMGSDWHDIAVVNTANDSTTTWTIPMQMGNEYLIRIESTTDPSVFDQSILPFSVSGYSIEPQFPKDGDRIGYLAEQTLSWSKENVDEIRVRYSLDNGKTFTTIVKGNISSVKFNFPDVQTDEGILIIESTENTDVNISVHFKLAKENVEFTSPLAGDTLNVNKLSKVVSFIPDLIKENFDIYFRANGGDWVKITNFAKRVDLNTNTFNWTFDESIKAGDTGQLQARISGVDEPIGESGIFLFAATTGVDERTYSPLFTISSLVPNPAKENFTIEVNNIYPKLMRTNIRIIDESGKILKTIADQYMVSGKSTMLIDVRELPAGTYYVMIESENNKDVQQLKVVR